MNRSPAESLQLTDRQRLHWLRLIRSENVGPATFRDLINRFGSAEAALAELPRLAAAGGAGKSIRVCTEQEADAELETGDRIGARLIAHGERDYPPMLRQTDHPPPLVWIRGDPEIFRRPAISIVGARNASVNGLALARRLASDLGSEGHVIVSGLARGIDSAAHTGSLDSGTIAVYAGGLKEPYPPENEQLSEAIAERGALISEMPIDWEPRSRDFPRRNRLIAALGLALVVVEAAQRSGSLITARLAAEMGRLVFAVPGSPLDPRASGTNGLIRNGATLVTCAADVLEDLTPLAQAQRPRRELEVLEEPPISSSTPPPLDNERSVVLEALGPAPTQIDDVLRHTGIHPAQLMTILLELDLAGRLERHGGGAVSLMVPDV